MVNVIINKTKRITMEELMKKPLISVTLGELMRAFGINETQPKKINTIRGRLRVADILGVSHMTLYRWEKRGYIDGLFWRVGNIIEYDVDGITKKMRQGLHNQK